MVGGGLGGLPLSCSEAAEHSIDVATTTDLEVTPLTILDVAIYASDTTQ